MTGAHGTGGPRDGYDREIDYLRISITDRCNLRCCYCMPEGGVKKLPHEAILSFEEILEVAETAVSLGMRKIRVTGGEPLARRDAIRLIHGLGRLAGLRDLGLTTNGTLLAGLAADLAKAGLHRVNVSLDCMDPGIYSEITRGGDVSRVIEGIDAALAAGIRVKVNSVLTPANAPHILEILDFARDRNVELRFIERMGPGGSGPLVSEDDVRTVVSRRAGLEPLPAVPGSPHVRRFLAGDVVVSFISPVSRPFCASCNRIRLTADGRLKPCLAGGRAMDARAVLRSDHGPDDVARTLLAAVAAKPAFAPRRSSTEMWLTGG